MQTDWPSSCCRCSSLTFAQTSKLTSRRRPQLGPALFHGTGACNQMVHRVFLELTPGTGRASLLCMTRAVPDKPKTKEMGNYQHQKAFHEYILNIYIYIYTRLGLEDIHCQLTTDFQQHLLMATGSIHNFTNAIMKLGSDPHPP